MKKRIFLVLVFFIITTSCAKQDTSHAPTPNSPIGTPGSQPLGAHFPQINIQTGNTDAIVMGELVLEDGCLRVSTTNTINKDSFLLIWDSNFSIRTELGIVKVIDSSTNEILASVGDYVEVGGGTAPADISLKEPIPPECPGPYWLVGDDIKKTDR